MSSKSAMIHARIDPELKGAVEGILKKLGITSAEAIRLFFSQIANKKAIPFPLNLENEDDKKHYKEVKSEDDLRQLIGLN